MTGHKLIAQSPHFQQYRQDGGGLGWGDRKIKRNNEIKIWRKERKKYRKKEENKNEIKAERDEEKGGKRKKTIVGLTQRKKKQRKGKLSKKHKRKEK